jgi:hypothetical protein
MNLIERITQEMADDDDNMTKQSELLAETYESADAAGKKLLDDAFVCLCGWTMKTLLEWQAKDPDGDNDEDDTDSPTGWQEG